MFEVLAVVIPVVIGAIFTWLKVKAGKDYAAVVEALEVGVNTAWESYGRNRKKELGTSFPEEDREKLRDIAKSKAREVSGKLGLDLDTVIPPAFQDLAISKIVREVKKNT